MTNIGNTITLSIPEFSITDIQATIMAIRPTKINTRDINWLKQKNAPVIGEFKRYVTDVHTYTLRDKNGPLSYISATPNHPFYVKNDYDNAYIFLPIEKVS